MCAQLQSSATKGRLSHPCPGIGRLHSTTQSTISNPVGLSSLLKHCPPALRPGDRSSSTSLAGPASLISTGGRHPTRLPRPGSEEPTSSARPGGSFSSSRAISRPGRHVIAPGHMTTLPAVRMRKHRLCSASCHGFESQPWCRGLPGRFGAIVCSVRPSVRR